MPRAPQQCGALQGREWRIGLTALDLLRIEAQKIGVADQDRQHCLLGSGAGHGPVIRRLAATHLAWWVSASYRAPGSEGQSNIPNDVIFLQCTPSPAVYGRNRSLLA